MKDPEKHVEREDRSHRQARLEQREYAHGKTVSLAPRSIALPDQVRFESVRVLTQLQADTMALRDLYKKHHWQVSGSTFYELHLLYDKHYEEQVELIDHIAERIQMLGGESIGFPHEVAEMTGIPRPPRHAEEPDRQLERLLEAHEIVLLAARPGARSAEKQNDDGTLDLLVSEVIPTHERQAWFISQQRAAVSAGRAPEREKPNRTGTPAEHHS